MKHFIILLVLFALPSLLFAQNEASISGRIFDGQNNEALPFASVTLNENDQLLGGTISNEDGRFVFSGVKKGSYKIQCSFIGYKTVESDLLVGDLNKHFDLGRIELFPEAGEIEEVTVTAQREILSSSLDKKTFNVQDNIAQSGGSVLDAMKTMPGISVDQEGKIMLRGSDRVTILIDGKQSSLTGFGNQKGLESLPASQIERIEIINNPSAKYDASGMAGVINIVSRKEKETGLHGDFGLAFGLGALGKRKADLTTELGSFSPNPKYIPSFSLNYKSEKLRLFLTSESMFLNHLPNNEFTTRTYTDGTRIASQVPENRRQQHYIVNGGVDFYLNEHNTLTFAAIYDWESHVDTAQVPYMDLNTMQRRRMWHWNEEEITGFMNYSLNYHHRFAGPGHELSARAQYTRGWEDESYFLNDSSALRQGTDATHILATEHTTNVSADYSKPMRNGRLEAGAKLQWRRLPVDYTVTPGQNSIIYPAMGDWSDWGEDIYSAYANYVYERPKFDIEAGLRVENTRVFYTIAPENIYYPSNDSYSYFELFPNVRFTLKPNEHNSVSAFYNRRVDRPGEPELRIFPKYDDPELLKVGNPYLRPQFTQIFELAYKRNWESGSAYVSLYHRIIEDAFQRVYSIDDRDPANSIINKIYHNTGEGQNTGIELIFSQQMLKSWKLSGSINGYKNQINAYEGVLYFPYERTFNIEKTSDNTWDVKLNNQFNLPQGFQLQLTGVYYAPKNIPQGKQMARSSVDLGVKKGLPDGKGELTFSFSDIFNRFGIRQEYTGNGFTALYENFYETQVARLGFKYKF